MSSASRDEVIHRHRVSPWPALPMDDAISTIMNSMPEGTCKFIPATLAKPGQVLVSRVVARSNVPEYHTSIKDGYAVIASDTSPTRRVVGVQVAAAADSTITPLSSGQCIRVCTGSILPPGADAVVMVEHTELIQHDGTEEQVIEMKASVKKGQDVRSPGADIREGDTLLEAGTVLAAAEIGLLASTARRDIEVYRRPRVCVMSTGNEVSGRERETEPKKKRRKLVDCSVDDQLAAGQVRDSNRPQLMALFHSRGFKPIDAGIIPDNRESLIDGIKVALRFASVLVTTGGVSMGEKDLMKDVLEKDLGFKIHFGRVWMKPGLPATFATGTVDDSPCAVFALPGNPVSSFVCAELFAVPALRKMGGYANPDHSVIKVTLANSIKLDARPEYVRAVMRAPSARAPSPILGNSATVLLPSAYTTGQQCSSRLLSLSGANLLLRLPARTDDCTVLPEGTVVDALVVGNL
ncbi:hypothetical protein PFISCL1PPCAC_2088 [Pristionchus fissidentatus]|uniref:MoaB/Mog domain-containing protein n=1 Tax=Pristionchus fissidentatus TaxID=1538716 RepID=A0AAV5UWA1_9BILA|nr:hypothetical protein PFISCL1PPCAC_2088 [Pristionchus fissidentatus]